MQKKMKRSVRFSHDLQQNAENKEQNMEESRLAQVSRFMLNIPSQSSIMKSSQQSIDMDIKKNKEDEDSPANVVESSRD